MNQMTRLPSKSLIIILLVFCQLLVVSSVYLFNIHNEYSYYFSISFALLIIVFVLIISLPLFSIFYGIEVLLKINGGRADYVLFKNRINGGYNSKILSCFYGLLYFVMGIAVLLMMVMPFGRIISYIFLNIE